MEQIDWSYRHPFPKAVLNRFWIRYCVDSRFKTTIWMVFISIVIFLAGECNSTPCLAGASASQWVVVVNGSSDRSRTIANHYTNWRNIPAKNIIVLNEVPPGNSIGIEAFREKILKPVLQEVESRRLSAHIQGIAYSSDFPLAVSLSEDLSPNPNRSQYLTPIGSINGMTYLYRFVLAKQSDNYLTFVNNFYVQQPGESLFKFLATSEAEAELLKELAKAKEEKNHQESAMLLDRYFDAHPHQFPVAYASAQSWATAGQPIKAMDRLQKSIELGWSFADFIKTDPQLESLRSERRYQALVRSCEEDSFQWTPALGFDGRRFYSPNGTRSFDPKQGVSYLLSMVLAVCTELGNSESEVLTQLKTATLADFSYPSGTFYITDTDDVRTTCRKAGFQIAVDQLKAISQSADIIPTILPISKRDVLGVTMGTAVFAWAPSQSRFIPGAIADNLTSLGGAMEDAQQTKLTEFLRNGAAAASGAVTEPYSIQAKFPHPTIHASYASGLTCAESFYSSVAGPYQLLIVGDPLCQPFAHPPKFDLKGVDDGQSMRSLGRIEFKSSKEDNTLRPHLVSVLIDGVLRGQVSSVGSVNVNDPQIRSGVHELRFIATSDTRQEERWESARQVISGSADQQLNFQSPTTWSTRMETPLSVSAHTKLPGAIISIRHDWETIATLSPGQSDVELPRGKLGRGPVRLQAVAKFEDYEVYSLPIVVNVTP